MINNTVKPTVTFLDGATYQKDFPAWVPQPGVPLKNPENASKEQRSNVYYESLKPIFIVLTMAGILPVSKINKIGNHKVQVVVVGGVSLAIYCVFAYLTFFVTRDIVFLIFHDEDFSSIIVQVTLMMLLLQHVFYFVLTWPESLAVRRYLEEWRNFQKEYEEVTSRSLVLSCRRRSLIVLLCALLLSAAYPQFVSMIDSKSITSSTAYLTIFYHIFIQLCFYILWFSNSWAVCQAADQYNFHLSQEFLSAMTAEKLEDYRLVWLRLTELVRSGSSMLCYTMALMITTPFAYQVIAAYNLTMFVIRSIQGHPDDSTEAIATGLTFLFYTIMLYMFCDAGHNITAKCEKVQDLLLAYNPSHPSSTAKLNSEIRLFLRCLRSLPPHATLGGYVIINRKVFLHMSGVLVTYLIILVQFNIGSLHKT